MGGGERRQLHREIPSPWPRPWGHARVHMRKHNSGMYHAHSDSAGVVCGSTSPGHTASSLTPLLVVVGVVATNARRHETQEKDAGRLHARCRVRVLIGWGSWRVRAAGRVRGRGEAAAELHIPVYSTPRRLQCRAAWQVNHAHTVCSAGPYPVVRTCVSRLVSRATKAVCECWHCAHRPTAPRNVDLHSWPQQGLANSNTPRRLWPWYVHSTARCPGSHRPGR